MCLRAALFEMKEALLNHRVGRSEEEFISQLEEKHKINSGTLVFYYNNLIISIKQRENQKDSAKKINRKWTKNETNFMFQYINERQQEGALNITEVLEEVAQLLDRGYQSVNYKYYSLLKSKENQKSSVDHDVRFVTISEAEVPVIATEAIISNPAVVNKPSKDGDLIDLLSGIISNVEQLQGINLNDLLGSLLQLTSMAVQNQQTAQQFERSKLAITQEKETLKRQLLQEKKRNDQLQLEVSKLAKEIMAFNQLGDAAKIQNLKSYNQRLNYIIDGFGVVLQVGS